jgi:hypothetical protein
MDICMTAMSMEAALYFIVSCKWPHVGRANVCDGKDTSAITGELAY